MALAGEIKYSLCVLSLNDVKMSDDVLIQLMGEVPSKSLVLLEDVDAMFANRQGTTVIGLYQYPIFKVIDNNLLRQVLSIL